MVSTHIQPRSFLCFPRVYPPVFIPVFIIGFLFVVTTLISPEAFKVQFLNLSSWINHHLGWVYATSANVFLLFCVLLVFLPIGKEKLGKKDDKPDFSFISWLTMMFSAGMGIGLIYWSMAEPLMHYAAPPYSKSFSNNAINEAFSWTFLHWGLHTWAIYALLALALCWGVYRCHLPMTIRSCLYGLFPESWEGIMGNLIDTLAVLGTLFGVATSLGLGVMQLNSGLNKLIALPNNLFIQILLIIGITFAATLSVLSGLGKGIKWLSNINMIIASLLVGLVLWFGPTEYFINTLPTNIVSYLINFIPWSLDLSQGMNDWKANWTHFYLGWWIAWAPFVGLFIARISKGRTIKEFILGALILPTVLTLIWVHVFGSTGLYVQHHLGFSITETMGNDPSQSLFLVFQHIPYGDLLSGLAMLALFTFFVTSSDSGSLVVDMITAGGAPNPPKIQKVFWASMEGILAIVLLTLGGLKAIQAAAICTGLPFVVMLILVMINLIRQFLPILLGHQRV